MIPSPDLACRDALRRLDDYVDRALSPNELQAVEAHLEECLRCAQKFRFESSLVEGIRARLRRLSIPPSLSRNIRLRLRADLPKEPFPGD